LAGEVRGGVVVARITCGVVQSKQSRQPALMDPVVRVLL
jgi:hypothetical protein